jgi:hypothetical protein
MNRKGQMITIFFSFFLILTVITIISIESANLRTNQNINSLQQGYNLPRLEYYNFLNAISKINLVNPSNQTNSIFNSSIQDIYNNLLQNFNLSSSIVVTNSIILRNFSKFGLTLINTQPVATPSPFQQMISITNGDPFWTYIARNSNLGQNVEFTYSNGSVIPSWLESYTINNATWWIKISGLSANSNMTIYIKIYSSSTNLFNNKTTGEAPQLSSTYGEYDDGANVFNVYTNFASSSSISGFTAYTAGGGSASFSNGASFNTGTSASPSFSFLVYNKEFPNSVTGALITEVPVARDETIEHFGFTSSSIPSSGITNYVGMSWYETCSYAYHGNNLYNVSSISSNTNGLPVQTVLSSSNAGITGYYNNTPVLSSSQNAIASDTYPVIGVQSYGSSSGCPQSETAQYQWFYVRAYPPNGIMPSETVSPSALPSNIVNYAPITIINDQPSATPNPFQQMVNISSNLYSSYEASNLQNVEFFYANGTVIPSWLESGTSSSNAIYWLRLPSLPVYSQLSIYVGFAPTSTNLFNNVNVGEAPQLSSTYGEYDDGVNVFNFYSNFAGTSLNSNQWNSGTSGGSITVNNNITIYAGTSSYAYIIGKSSVSSPMILDSYVSVYSVSGAPRSFPIGFSTANDWVASSQGGNAGGLDNSYLFQMSNSLTSYEGSEYNLSGLVTLSQSLSVPGIAGISWESSSPLQAGYINDQQVGTAENTNISFQSYYPSAYIETGGGGTAKFTLDWINGRAIPPNGVMPFVNFGSVYSVGGS